jgi:hypothetical protein
VEGKKNFCGGGVRVASGSVTYSDNYGTVESDTRVFEPNTVTSSYQTYARRFNTRPDNYVFDATFFKLREMSATYDVPQKIANKMGMSSASISLIGQNLWMWTKQFRFTDPDVAEDTLASPSVRYVGFNVKLNF